MRRALAALAVCAASGFAEDIAPGITFHSFTRPEGPFRVSVLEVDPANPAIDILPVRANDRSAGRETVSSMAHRYHAAAAVNGGYFVVAGPYRGTSNGVYQLNGDIVASGAHRTALLFCSEVNHRERTAMGVVNFAGRVTTPDGHGFALAGLNRQPSAGELVVFSPAFGPRTLTAPGTSEADLDARGRVVSLAAHDTAISAKGSVLSGAGYAATWLERYAARRARLSVQYALEPMTTPADCAATDIVGAGPMLVASGLRRVTPEGFAHQNVRHPRTALAVTRKGTFLFVVVDGRQKASVGMTLDELATLLLELGAVEAINLDGGGSSTLYAHGTIRNSPSDGKERPVSDGILIFSIPDAEALDRTYAALAPTHLAPQLASQVSRALSRRRWTDFTSLLRKHRGRGVSKQAARILLEGAVSVQGR